MSGTGPVKRVTLWVRNAEASLALYRDVLGLAVIEDKRLAGAAIARIVGLEDVSLRIVHLAPPGVEYGWIGLYELRDPRPAVVALPAPPPDRPAYGQATIVLTTDRMDSILPQLRARGVRFLAAPQPEYVKTEPGGPTPAGRYSEAIFFDPDGVPVSLIGYAPL